MQAKQSRQGRQSAKMSVVSNSTQITQITDLSDGPGTQVENASKAYTQNLYYRELSYKNLGFLSQ
jgi:hypothetical protein